MAINIIQNKSLYYDKGVTYMGDKYIINGQAGAVGRKAKAEKNIFNQNIDNKEIELTKEDILKLTLYIEKLSQQPSSEISKSESSQAVAFLYSIIEAVEKNDKNEQRKALSNWKDWIGKTSVKTMDVLGRIADLVTIGMPLATILGLAATSTG